MADNTNKVTIDAAWFAELYAKANGERYTVLEAAHNQVVKERDNLIKKLNNDAKDLLALTNERDELKRDIAATEQERDAFRRDCENLKGRKPDYLEEFNSEGAARTDLMKELDLAREMYARVCKERDELTAKMDDARHMQAVANENSTAFQKRLAAAERCIEDCWEHIYAYREKE